MRRLTVIASLFLLSACDGGSQPIDASKFFAALEGPKVPTVQDAMLESAKNSEKQGDFKGAAQTYQQVLEKHPDNKDVILSLAEAYRRSGDDDRAIALYDELLKRDGNNLAAKEGKGLALMAKGDFDTPAALFDEIVKVDQTRWKTLNALGVLFTTRNMHPEAQLYFQAAIRQSPANPSILNNLGLSQALNHQPDAAIASLTQASALTPADSVDRKRIDLNLALVYAIAGKLDDANAIAEQYFTGPVLDNNKGLYAHLAKDDQMAKAYLNMALTESKTFYQRAWNNLQQIDTTSTSAAKNSGVTVSTTPPEPTKEPAPATPATKPVPEEKVAPVKKSAEKKPVQKSKPKNVVPKTDNDIADIVGSTGDNKDKDKNKNKSKNANEDKPQDQVPNKDKVPDSPIP